MKQVAKNNNVFVGTFGKMERVKDFLPSPEDLVMKKKENIKVTLNLKKSSVDMFKNQAKKLGGSYQHMIRNLIDTYAQHLG